MAETANAVLATPRLDLRSLDARPLLTYTVDATLPDPQLHRPNG